MEADLIAPLLTMVVVAIGSWTLWTLNAGRRMARWGRRKIRRIALLLLVAATAFFALGR